MVSAPPGRARVRPTLESSAIDLRRRTIFLAEQAEERAAQLRILDEDLRAKGRLGPALPREPPALPTGPATAASPDRPRAKASDLPGQPLPCVVMARVVYGRCLAASPAVVSA